MSKSTVYAVCTAERTGDSSLVALFSTIKRDGQLKSFEMEFNFGTDLYIKFFGKSGINEAVSIVKSQVINFQITFEDNKITTVVQDTRGYQKKQELVFSYSFIEKINQYKTPVQQYEQYEQVKVQQPAKYTPQHTTPATPVPAKQPQVSTAVQCQGNHVEPKYLIKGEVDFMRQNNIKFENRMLCMQCVIKNHNDNK